MRQFFILYYNPKFTGYAIFQTHFFSDSKEKVKLYFNDYYNATLVAIRTGRPYSKREMKLKKKSLLGKK